MKRILVLFIIFLLSVSVAQAKNTASFRIGCTIPAIPGINAPAQEQQTEIDPEMLIEETAIVEKLEEKNEETITQIGEEIKDNRIVLVKTIVVK